MLSKYFGLLVLERLGDRLFQLHNCSLFSCRSDRFERRWSGTWAWSFLLTKGNGSSCNQTETTKNKLSFHTGFLGQPISAVDFFLDLSFHFCACPFHIIEDDGAQMADLVGMRPAVQLALPTRWAEIPVARNSPRHRSPHRTGEGTQARTSGTK